jgi:hypothetical protein
MITRRVSGTALCCLSSFPPPLLNDRFPGFRKEGRHTVVCGDAVVVDHAAGVEGVAGLLAGAATVQDAAVLAVPQQRRDFRRTAASIMENGKANRCQLLAFPIPPRRNCRLIFNFKKKETAGPHNEHIPGGCNSCSISLTRKPSAKNRVREHEEEEHGEIFQ